MPSLILQDPAADHINSQMFNKPKPWRSFLTVYIVIYIHT